MEDCLKVSGMVLGGYPQGDHDKRLVILTCELGKVTAFARGCRRPGNPLLAAANAFAMGTFTLVPSGSAYRLAEAEIKDYFRELAGLQPEVYYGYYFLELAEFYGREGIGARDTLNLLYVALKALMGKKQDREYVRRVFELKLFYLNGDLAAGKGPEKSRGPVRTDAESDAELQKECSRIWSSALGRLYGGMEEISPELLEKLGMEADRAYRRIIGKELSCKRIMKMMAGI